jgi:hypothetical protein
MIKQFVLSIFLFSLFFSCSAPPPGTKRVLLLDSLHQVLKSEAVSVGIQDVFFTFRRAHNTEDLVTVMKKGDTLSFTGTEAVPQDRTILYTLGNHRLKIHRTVYVTEKKNGDLFYSLDSEHWFPMSNNRKKEILNVHYHYRTWSRLDPGNKHLEIEYYWDAMAGENAVEVKMKEKDIVTLGKGMVILHDEKSENTVDLTKVFLKIPAGTDVSYLLIFSGNLIHGETRDSTVEITILRDFYFYTSDSSDYKVGISLNGSNWNYSVLGFKFKESGAFYVPSPGHIYFLREINIRYGSDE